MCPSGGIALLRQLFLATRTPAKLSFHHPTEAGISLLWFPSKNENQEASWSCPACLGRKFKNTKTAGDSIHLSVSKCKKYNNYPLDDKFKSASFLTSIQNGRRRAGFLIEE